MGGGGGDWAAGAAHYHSLKQKCTWTRAPKIISMRPFSATGSGRQSTVRRLAGPSSSGAQKVIGPQRKAAGRLAQAGPLERACVRERGHGRAGGWRLAAGVLAARRLESSFV